MRRVRRGDGKQSLPSSEEGAYFIGSYPPEKSEKTVWKEAVAYCSSTALLYARSGKLYSRHIFSNRVYAPRTENEGYLRGIDYAAIHAFTRHKDDLTPLFGKWLVYVDEEIVDSVWNKFSRDIENGKLPYRAKISTRKENPFLPDKPKSKHLICIYTPNFLWRENLREVRLVLRDYGFREKLHYRPDIITILQMGSVEGSKFRDSIFSDLARYGVHDPKTDYRYFG